MAIDKNKAGRPTVGQMVYQTPYTKEQLETLVAGNLLTEGAEYLLSDYFTKHEFVSHAGVIHTSTAEPLVLTAISNNKFSSRAKSTIYPKHEITYDFDNVVCEDIDETPRPGLIVERYDPETNTRCKFDFIGCKVRLFEITGKVYTSISKGDDDTLLATIDSNIPSLSNQRRYEVSFDTMTHTEGEKEITITYNNGTVTKPLKYYLDQTDTGTIPENYLSEKKGTIVYNPVLDAYVLMAFRDIGSELIGTFSSPVRSNITLGYGGITFQVDSNSYQDVDVFSSTYKNVYLPAEAGKNIPSTAFIGQANDIFIRNYCQQTVFTKNINGFRVGDGVNYSIIDSSESNHLTDNYITNSLILNSGFSFYYVDHHFKTLSRSVITPCANMYLGALDQVSIILKAAGNFNGTATIQASNFWLTGLNIGGTPNNFYLKSPVLRALIGYFDNRDLNISKALTDATLFERDSNTQNILGKTEVDTLKFNNTPSPTHNAKTFLAFNEEKKAVSGGPSLVDDPDTMANMGTGFYNNYENTAPDDLPVEERGVALVLVSESSSTQLWVDVSNNHLYIRSNTGSSGGYVYSSWKRIVNLDDLANYMTLTGAAQDVDSVKNFAWSSLRIRKADTGVGHKNMQIRNLANTLSEPDQVNGEKVIGLDGNDNLFITRGFDDRGVVFKVDGFTDFRTITFQDKSYTVIGIEDVTAAIIKARLEAVVDEEDKLDSSAIKGTAVSSVQFKTVDVGGIMTMFLDTDEVPTDGSIKAMTSGDLYTYLEGLKAAASADTSADAAGANPTKAEFDALRAELLDLKTKMRASGILKT